MTTRRRLSTGERRAAILTAARDHFATTSYPDASIPTIAAASGSSQSLVFHYFSSKAGLYAAVVEDSLRSLIDAPLPAGHSTRDRVSTVLQDYLDALAADHTLVAGVGEPEAAVALRRAAADALVEKLREITGIRDFPRHHWALWGWVGFLEAAGRHWVDDGCPEDQRRPLIDAALGALEGALGDWQV